MLIVLKLSAYNCLEATEGELVITFNRRDFVTFLGGVIGHSLVGCTRDSSVKSANYSEKLPQLESNNLDKLSMLEGLNYEVLLEWGQPIGKDIEFGFNNDYLAVLPTGKTDESWLWINHEYTNPLFVSGAKRGDTKTKDQIETEMKSVGGSLVKIKRNLKTNRWMFVPGSGRRFDAKSEIPFAKGMVKNSKTAIGTMGNCAGGYTPWRTFLTCEENIDGYYGDVNSKGKQIDKPFLQWENFYQYPPEHYGWVVEINPSNGKAKKHIALGRFAHESCTVHPLKDGRVVAYSGDDKADEHLYRFVSSKPNSLDEGELFVADIKKGKWLSLDYEKQAKLQKNFKDQIEVLTFCREAAKILGATPLDRPEDIEIHPKTGDVYVALTNNVERMNFHGSIMKLIPENGDHESENFSASDFLVGGDGVGFSCPDNLAFDAKGNLWFTTDISGKLIGKPPYTSFGNNGLYYVALSGENAGIARKLIQGPIDSELTGICFTPDGTGLFLSVQHPGELTKDLDKPTSHWPRGGSEMPRPSVVEVRGPLLEKLLS
ncbi:MAG: alkaline phosphatase [Bdellovibrionales bacterium CG12_big_fil_rev_8_21_14_0_65_38_15]|nr:MAG: alkaline phosphatase [Bdellovibrionales bacterium CG22_combo_CG10-13_8_21_14_all_38_13]PIQ57099.1 MAG: alkaline phosphatase [Bdellovibrionales bacterium CG12_big_fil_rev_8_21_14_0_65_38_15]PIR30129.1 MAG: alkaline phosphatase [Bdellovibrionales bacterium CG11_big_fil_rev_8_21_14_0_20_38_13]